MINSLPPVGSLVAYDQNPFSIYTVQNYESDPYQDFVVLKFKKETIVRVTMEHFKLKYHLVRRAKTFYRINHVPL